LLYRAAFAVANRACSEHCGSQHPLPPVNQPGSSAARRKMLKKATRKLDRDLASSLDSSLSASIVYTKL